MFVLFRCFVWPDVVHCCAVAVTGTSCCCYVNARNQYRLLRLLVPRIQIVNTHCVEFCSTYSCSGIAGSNRSNATMTVSSCCLASDRNGYSIKCEQRDQNCHPVPIHVSASQRKLACWCNEWPMLNESNLIATITTCSNDRFLSLPHFPPY